MTAPDLLRMLTLETRTLVPDSGGGVTEVWAPLGAHWAEVLPSAAAERTAGGVAGSTVTHRIRIRWAPYGAQARPAPHQRLRDGARIYDILGVTEADTRSRWLLVWAREGAA